MKTKSKKFVTLKIYKGSEIVRGEDGNVKNENQTVTIQIDSLEFKKYVEHLPFSQYRRVEILECFEVQTGYNNAEGKYHPEVIEKIETPKEVSDAITNMFKGKKAQLTPEQQRIADLEAKLESLMKSQPNPENGKTPKISVDERAEPSELDELRAEYESLAGKKPNHLLKEDKLRDKIAELKTLNVSE
jgi:hypothetical protein